MLLAGGIHIYMIPTYYRLYPLKPGVDNTPRQTSIYSISVQHALKHAQASHESKYFRELAAALLAAPREAAAARRPYHCMVGAGGSADVAGNTTLSIHPISFSIPISLFQKTVPPKGQPFSTVIPGLPSTYR
jgi:hypothetical protein